MRHLAPCALVVVAAVVTAGCGYSEDQWQALLAENRAIVAETQKVGAARDAAAQDHQSLEERATTLEKELREAGVDMEKLNERLAASGAKVSSMTAELTERERAIAQYKQRARQLELIKARFAKLRAKLDQLSNLGLRVEVRNGRMVIVLPGDVLFSRGSTTLRTEAEEVLDRVAAIINGDENLRSRQFQVAGHTDDDERGSHGDRWGLSAMRARAVLLHLIHPDRGLPRDKWSAAALGETDPRGDNATPEGRAANRRCEIIVVPSAEEMLDLKDLAQ